MTYDAGKFWAHVTVGGVTDCWPWTGRVDDAGYGRYKGQGAHRLSLYLSGVPMDSRHDVDHECGVKGCVSPFHLRVMTHADHARVTASMRGQQHGNV